MGNVQTASIANQLLPFETYISDVPELKVSHRFFFRVFLDHIIFYV